MSKVDELPKYGNYIDGAVVPPASNEYLPTENPYSGKVWALIGRGDENDVAVAAAAAERALNRGEWPRMSGDATRPSAVAARRPHHRQRRPACRDRTARQRQNRCRRLCAQIRYMGDYFKYYGGLADKVQGAVIPTDKRDVFTYTKYEPKGVVAHHHAVELATYADELETRPGACRGLHSDHQAVRVHVGVDARIRAAFRRGGISQRRRQRHHRTRARSRRSAGRASRRLRMSGSPEAMPPGARSISSLPQGSRQ